MSLRLMDEKGRHAEARGREPNEAHWGHYRKAQKRRPDLLRAVYSMIDTEMSAHDLATEARSRDFGRHILSHWPDRDDWNQYCANEEVSSSLFGQIMWTYFYDRGQTHPEEKWWTTLTGTLEREERAYFLERPQTEPEPSPTVEIDLERGDRVRITDGPFENYEGTVEEIIQVCL